MKEIISTRFIQLQKTHFLCAFCVFMSSVSHFVVFLAQKVLMSHAHPRGILCFPVTNPLGDWLLWPSSCSRRLRWNSFQLSHQPRPSPASPHISSQTASQLSLLQRFSLLRLTAIMEKYSMPNKHGWTWCVALLQGLRVHFYRDCVCTCRCFSVYILVSKEPALCRRSVLGNSHTKWVQPPVCLLGCPAPVQCSLQAPLLYLYPSVGFQGSQSGSKTEKETSKGKQIVNRGIKNKLAIK